MTNYSAGCLISKLDHILSSLTNETSESKTTAGDRIIVKHFKGILIYNYARDEYTTVQDLYFDTSTNILYIMTHHERYASTTEVDPDLPFHEGLSYVKRIDAYTDTIRIGNTNIDIKACYQFPFIKTFNGTIIDGYTIHEFDTNNRQYHYTPITYEHIKKLFETIRDRFGKYVPVTDGIQRCYIGDTESYIILGQKILIRSDLSYCTYDNISYLEDRWKPSPGSTTKLERRSQLINLIGVSGGWKLIKELEDGKQFEEIMGPEIVYD